MRLTRVQYYLKMAKLVSERSTCNLTKNGCIFVDRNHRILSTGYAGAPSGHIHCEHNYKSPVCYSIHAAINALCYCQLIEKVKSIYMVREPCFDCLLPLMNTSAIEIFILTEPTLNAKRKWEKSRQNRIMKGEKLL